jgi:L-alanine-DL-glutamate epimerase-like enolase superfamily enzyme
MDRVKVTEVEPIVLYVPFSEAIAPPIAVPYPERTGPILFSGYRSVLVRIRTDDGIEGYGECMTRLAPRATAALVEELAQLVIGRDPMDSGAIWEEMYGLMLNRAQTKGFYIEAISGIDIALWDIRGKALDQPVYKLLGGMHRPQITTYASSLRFRTIETTVETAQAYLDAGFQAMKIKIGPSAESPRREAEIVRVVREAVGPAITLMVDANCGYDLGMAIQVAKALEPFDLAWFEEPLRPDDLDGYRLLGRATSVPIAAGECEYTRFGHKTLLDTEAIRVLQPSACRAGGITESERIASLASAYHVGYAPHTGSSSAIAMAVALHLAASAPNFVIYEYMMSDWSKTERNPLRWELFEEDIPLPVDGQLDVASVLSGTGLGFTVNRELVQKYRLA